MNTSPHLIYKRKTRLEILARDKHSSLLRPIVNYGRKKFYNVWLRRRKTDLKEPSKARHAVKLLRPEPELRREEGGGMASDRLEDTVCQRRPPTAPATRLPSFIEEQVSDKFSDKSSNTNVMRLKLRPKMIFLLVSTQLLLILSNQVTVKNWFLCS